MNFHKYFKCPLHIIALFNQIRHHPKRAAKCIAQHIKCRSRAATRNAVHSECPQFFLIGSDNGIHSLFFLSRFQKFFIYRNHLRTYDGKFLCPPCYQTVVIQIFRKLQQANRSRQMPGKPEFCRMIKKFLIFSILQGRIFNELVCIIHSQPFGISRPTHIFNLQRLQYFCSGHKITDHSSIQLGMRPVKLQHNLALFFVVYHALRHSHSRLPEWISPYKKAVGHPVRSSSAYGSLYTHFSFPIKFLILAH